MTRLKLAHIHRYRKGGRLYIYFRRGDQRIRLPGLPGSAEFMAAYQAALASEPPPIGASRTVPGSMAALAVDWYGSPGFTSMRPASQRTYRRLAELLLADHGDKPVALLEPKHVRGILTKRQATPAQANAILNVLRAMMQHAFDLGWRKDNPCRDVKRLRYAKKPFTTWSETDIAAFEAHWPHGTRARLAMALLLYTGQRRSDVVRMGPQHVKDGCITVVQAKTGARLTIPMHAELRAAVADLPAEHLAYLMTELGKPFTPVGFYNWFVDCARAAGLDKGLSPHGLRKAAARRLAEAGCPPHEIMAITGHTTLKEVERYTREVDQKRLASAAVVRLGGRRATET